MLTVEDMFSFETYQSHLNALVFFQNIWSIDSDQDSGPHNIVTNLS